MKTTTIILTGVLIALLFLAACGERNMAGDARFKTKINKNPLAKEKTLQKENAMQADNITNVTVTAHHPCFDSDGGINEFSAGTVQKEDRMGVTNIYKSDVCSNENVLIEYYCDENDDIKSVLINCDYGCIDGQCMTQETINDTGMPNVTTHS